MYDLDFAKKLIEFNFWENRRVWEEAVMPLSDDQFTTDTGYSWGTIQRECAHIITGEWGWLQQAQGATAIESFDFEDLAERQVIRQQWDKNEQHWQAFMADLTPERFFKDCVFLFRGKQVEMPTWSLIFHVVNHGTIHRSEILRMVAQVSEPVQFDLSMMQYLTRSFRE